ncbi:MAG TPA: sugar phosphate nucleotidyltransferase [Polyangiaceae bacterium]
MRQAVILAGGLATRMQPRTLTVPKFLLEVAGRPFADWQLEMLANCKYQRVVVCVAHLGEQIREHVGDGARWGLSVDYSEEGPELLGTGGALRAAASLLDDTFLVTYGDSYLPFDYAAPLDALRAHDDCDGVMSVFRNAGKWDPSNVRTDGTWVLAYEKETRDPAFDHIDYGAIALRKKVVLELPDGARSGLDGLQSRLAAAHRLRASVARERFYEIGSPDGLAALEQRLQDHR